MRRYVEDKLFKQRTVGTNPGSHQSFSKFTCKIKFEIYHVVCGEGKRHGETGFDAINVCEVSNPYWARMGTAIQSPPMIRAVYRLFRVR